MRLVLASLTALALVAGCGNDGAPGGNDLAMSLDDGGGTDTDLSGVADDLAGGGGPTDGGSPGDGPARTDGFMQSTDLGGAGATCTTACDCTAGLACAGGKCVSGTVAVYCCPSTTCPSGAICQGPTGSYGQCGRTNPDLGAFDYCQYISCNGANGLARCTSSGCTQCVAATGGGGMVCAK